MSRPKHLRQIGLTVAISFPIRIRGVAAFKGDMEPTCNLRPLPRKKPCVISAWPATSTRKLPCTGTISAWAQHRCGDVEDGALQVRCGAELELGRPDRNLGRQLEPVQGPRRQWLERIRDSIHLAPVRLEPQPTR